MSIKAIWIGDIGPLYYDDESHYYDLTDPDTGDTWTPETWEYEGPGDERGDDLTEDTTPLKSLRAEGKGEFGEDLAVGGALSVVGDVDIGGDVLIQGILTGTVAVNTDLFDRYLSISDDTVQKAFDTLDDKIPMIVFDSTLKCYLVTVTL